MKISLVISTYNRLHTLPQALDAVQRLRYPDLEVIVVDGPSTDGTMDYLKKNWQGKLKILQCPEANLSMSRNIGILAAQGEIVAFTDDDGIPEPDWLDKIAPAYDDVGVGAVGGFVRNHTGVEFQTKYIISKRDGNSDVLIDDHSLVPKVKPGSHKFPGMIGVNSTFRRNALLEIGGFDLEYEYFLDETDVVARLVDAGYLILIVEDAEVHHKYARSHIRSEKGLPRTWLPIARSTAYFCIRNNAGYNSLLSVFEYIDRSKHNFINNTNWALTTGGLTADEANDLKLSIYKGLEEGVRDAFAHPWRKLICQNSVEQFAQPWLPFRRLMPAQMRQLKIAFVTDLYPPRPCGGIAVFMHQLAKHLAAIGHEITVITFGEPDRPHTVDMEDGVWVHRLAACSFDRVSSEVPFMPESSLAMSEQVLAEIDRVQIHRNVEWVIGTIWDLHIAAVIASKRYRVGMYLVTSYGLMLESKPEWKSNSHYFENHIQKMIEAEHWALDEVDLVLASTRAIHRDVENFYDVTLNKAKTVIQPFGIKAPDLALLDDRGIKSRVQILFVGRFEVRKGIIELLEIIPGLLKRNRNIEFKLVGDNTIPSFIGLSYWDEFSNKYSSEAWFDRVEVTGIIDDESLEKAYADCDVFVAPSRYESFGLIYVEAMRYKKPCIGCDVGGVPEVVINGKSGILVSVNDPEAISNAVQLLVDDPILREKYGNAGYQRYNDNFTIDAFAKGFAKSILAV
ncbi:glycosyltransferase [Ferribacterium limneticum]|uniref:glycosyltransferase n=1 Tax=Ferribacterium limneticum TaxID=76259 RepID=UPI001CF9FB86|nr:glycosyltransferase [Ferribacterium limneticum]UCV20754.1 glycosyltransferase [Ferribacterium limneticum]